MAPGALVMMACAWLGIREPGEFYTLSEAAQELWIEHALNTVTGAYDATEAPTGAEPTPSATGSLQAWTAQAIREAKARGVLTADGYDPTRARG
jgi:hypothetical protein